MVPRLAQPPRPLHPLSDQLVRLSSFSAPAPAVARWQARRSCAAAAAAGSGQPGRRRLVFLGTPEVAALVLDKLLAAAAQPDAAFEVAAVVTQPGRPRGRGKVAQPSPVAAAAAAAGLPADRLLCPERAGEPGFIDALRALRPDLCVTAAYGNYLPGRFLAVPPGGTLNIHPSLLPLYRGAAPVQRALQDGAPVSGVTLLFSVREMDAGPLLAQQAVQIDPDIQAPELLTQLFGLGADLLLRALREDAGVWDGSAEARAAPQDGAAATHAAKLSREESGLDFSGPPAAAHNHVRAFAGWPGSTAAFELLPAAGGPASVPERLELKVLRTRLAPLADWEAAGGDAGDREVRLAPGSRLLLRCGGSEAAGQALELVEVQAPGKKPLAARDFANGLKGRRLAWLPPGPAA